VISLETGNDSLGLTNNPAYKRTRLWAWARASRIGQSARACRSFRHELWAWARCKEIPATRVEQLTKSIEVLEAQASDPAKQTEAPIFLLSTGWRAGSTLLQRILVTDPRLLLWGEPLAEMTMIPRIAEMISQSISARNLQLWKDQHDPNSPALSTSWVANLYPPSADFRSGLQSIFNRWLGEPAYQRGFARWGLKEVRLGAADAVLLHWLYPNARFLIISRHPYDSYRSLADAGWGQVYHRYPDAPVDSAASFARHWNRLAVSWRQLPVGFPVIHIKYEDLIGGKVDFRELESSLGLEIKESIALSAEVGGTARRTRLSWFERMIIRREAGEGMGALGYSE
jgi:Sulfotransferase family